MQLGFAKKSMWNASWPVRYGRGGVKTCARGMTAERPILAVFRLSRPTENGQKPPFEAVYESRNDSI